MSTKSDKPVEKVIKRGNLGTRRNFRTFLHKTVPIWGDICIEPGCGHPELHAHVEKERRYADD